MEAGMSAEINRRNFIKQAALSTAGAGLVASTLGAIPVSASDKVRVAVIGAGLQGSSLMNEFLKLPDVQLAAVCDLYQPHLDRALKTTQGKADGYKDFRQVLDRKDIDAVVIATPDHWHAMQLVLACQSGKDVYIEKPISKTIGEGRCMVEAARRYDRVVQVGTQWNSSAHFQKGVELIQGGLTGKVTFVRMWNYLNFAPEGFGNFENSDPPANLDWDLWLGPAPKVLFNWNRFGGDKFLWSTFRYFWDYSGGWVTDWGVHFINLVHWALRVDGPTAATAAGGRLCLKDNCETPDTLQATFEYPGFLTTYEVRMGNQHSRYGEREYTGRDWDVLREWAIEFYGTDGTLTFDEMGLHVVPEKSRYGSGQVDRTPAMDLRDPDEGLLQHVRNFVDCVKSRQRPVCDIQIGQRASNACHVANIAYRTQSRQFWDAAKQQLVHASHEASNLTDFAYRAPWKLTV
jgi:predicted dehydrogenase